MTSEIGTAPDTRVLLRPVWEHGCGSRSASRDYSCCRPVLRNAFSQDAQYQTRMFQQLERTFTFGS